VPTLDDGFASNAVATGAGIPVTKSLGSTMARGAGGAAITDVVNLWKGSFAIGKGVNHVDWGSGCKCSNI
jgi:hypothetical protein